MDRGQRRVKGYMADIEPSTPGGENNLLDRILAAESVLVALRCGDTGMVTSALRHIALQTGKALYVWRPRAGLCRLRDQDEKIPGAVQLADVLRMVAGNVQFGVYFLAESPRAWGPELMGLLRRISQIDPREPRRLVLSGTLADVPPSLPARELAWGSEAGARLRLRHGTWSR
jgi:hypothetical protein